MAPAVVGAVFLLTTLTPSTAFANPDDDPKSPGQRQNTPGNFAFGAPLGYVAIKAGFNLPRADSDIYTFNVEQLTLDSNSFNGLMFGIDVGYGVGDRIDLIFGVEISGSSPTSEMRDFVDEFDAPITQQTRLRQVPMTASVRFNLMERGEGVGNYAWIPTTIVPYVGAGGGVMWWRYEQFGDFVDFSDFTIFSEHFQTQGWAPTFHVFGGADWSVTPRFAVQFEARYGWAEDDLAPAFTGFEPIDLAGFRGTVGALFRF